MIISENQLDAVHLHHMFGYHLFRFEKSPMHFHWFAKIFLFGKEHDYLVEKI